MADYFDAPLPGNNVAAQPAGAEEQFNQYAIFRDFAGVRNSAPPWQIGDNHFSNLVNAMPSEDGNIQPLPGHATSSFFTAGGSLTISAMFFTSRANSVYMWVFMSDGSAKELIQGSGSVNHSFAAGTFCSGPQTFSSGYSPACSYVTTWEDSVTLIIDPVKGYFSWDGTTLTNISSSTKGYCIAVHQGRVWIAQGRTVTFTGTAGYNDFNAANGAGAFTTKTDAVFGQITQLTETTTYLFIQTSTAVLVIGSIQFANGITVFGVQVLTNGVGQYPGSSCITSNGVPIFLSPLGIFAMNTGQPDLISDDLRGTYGSYNLGIGPTSGSSGFIFANGLAIPTFLVGNPSSALFLCFINGKWFFATDQNAAGTPLGIVQMATCFIKGTPVTYGFTGAAPGVVYKMFHDTSIALPATITTRAWDFGNAILDKNFLRIGIEGSFPVSTTPVCTLTGYQNTANPTTTPTLPAAVAGFNILRADAQMAGKYIQVTLTLTAVNWQISAFHIEYAMGTPW